MLGRIKRMVAENYLKGILAEEFKNPPFSQFNERPVEYRFVFEQLAEFYPKTLLDVGTGMTSLPHLIANCGIKVTALDNIRDFWQTGIFNRHFYVINDDITKSQLKEKFEMITCISTLEHIKEYDLAVKNMFELLQSGGYLILSFPYNEKKFTANVYDLPGSSAPANLPFKTAAFSRTEVDRWCSLNKAQVVKQEYWRFYDGEYWTLGERLSLPQKVNVKDQHQISCLLFRKND